MGVTMSLPTHLKILLLAFSTVFLGSCSSRAIHEAEAVVAQADSLWQAGLMYGTDAGDSLTLAHAYETLQEHSVFSRQLSEVCPFVPCTSLLRTYSHACYHYGKLLRAKDDPVEAMQAFINATHSRTRNYHILGRVYSNMGSICHLAGDFPLSYDMYEKSADMFLQNGDTLAYYYGLNDMAYELAEQGKKDETLCLLNNISANITDADIDVKIWEARAILYREVCQYDSTIYYARKVLDRYYSDAPMLLATAQSYYFLALYDSALVYANKVLATSDFYGDLYNALYIISHEDSTLTKEDILQLTSQREDIRFEEYEPVKEQLSRAVRLLEADMSKKPDWRWLYLLIAVALFVCSSLVLIHLWRKRKLHQQISEEIEIRQSHVNTLSLRQEEHRRQLLEGVETICANINESENWKKELCWNNYSQMCEMVNLRIYGFVTCLSPFCLSEKEVRLCILILLKAGTEKMVDSIPYAKSGLGKFKLTTARKLGTTTREMRNFLLNLMS